MRGHRSCASEKGIVTFSAALRLFMSFPTMTTENEVGSNAASSRATSWLRKPLASIRIQAES